MLPTDTPRIAVTGASSCTGFWIATSLVEAGYEVHALCARPAAAYRGRRRILLDRLARRMPIHFDLKAGAGAFPRWIREHRPDVWVNHHHPMKDFRKASYDLEDARAQAVAPLDDLLAALAEYEATGVVFTGSYFEPGEGGPEAPKRRTPYAHSKREAWNAIQVGCKTHGLLASKIVVPNAIGPLEAPERLIPALVHASRKGVDFRLASPRSSADSLPVRTLGQSYAQTVAALLEGRCGIRRPSGHTSQVAAWVETILRELVRDRLELTPCTIVTAAEGTAPALRFTNPAEERSPVDWADFWDHYAEWLRRHPEVA